MRGNTTKESFYVREGAMPVLGTAILGWIAAGVCLAGVALCALYMAGHLHETPGMKRLRCLSDPAAPGCPVYQDAVQAQLDSTRQELARLKAMNAAMTSARAVAEKRLAALRAVESAVSSFTLFETHGGLLTKDVVIGTIYRRITGGAPEPEQHYCYIELEEGPAGETRNLYFRTSGGDVDIDGAALKRAGISKAELHRARGLCKPRLIEDVS